MLRVCQVSPTYFAPESLLGGGERFAEELSRALAKLADVRFVSFGRRALRERPSESYERVILKSWSSDPMTPFSPRLLSELRGFGVIHCHQYNVLPTFLAAAFGRWQGSAVFVSDLGGGGWTPGYQVDQSRWITGHLPISEYAARALPGRPRPHRVIYGGVDLARYTMRPELTHDGSILFLGRVLPHKGIQLLIEALPAGRTLHVVGPAPDPAYLSRLRALASGREVRFHAGLSDGEVVAFLQRAQVLVHPTPVDAGGSAGASELFGLALVEAMACGCPVVASHAASLPEIVVDGETGVLVPPNSAPALTAALIELEQDDARWRRLALSSRRRVEVKFTWDHVARACLSAYEELS
jgi:glycosyltransferase involved in cell wall biosynthesis